MEKTGFDDKITGLKKAIESNRSMWRSILDSNEAKWREQLETSNRAIASLRKETDSLNAGWQTKYKEKQREMIDSNETCLNLRSELSKLQEQAGMREQSFESLKKELQMRQQEFDAKLDEKETNLRMLNAQISSSHEEGRILKSRLAEEQQRWDDVLQIKEKDFKVLQREMEQKAKDWEGQYQKEEQEIQIVREGRRKLEQAIEELSSRMRTQEIRAREQIDAKDDQIAALKRELQLCEEGWKEKFERKENELDSICSQVEEYSSEDGAKQAETPKTAIPPAAEDAVSTPEEDTQKAGQSETAISPAAEDAVSTPEEDTQKAGQSETAIPPAAEDAVSTPDEAEKAPDAQSSEGPSGNAKEKKKWGFF